MVVSILTSVLRPGVILQKGPAPLDSPMALGAALLAPESQKGMKDKKALVRPEAGQSSGRGDVLKV